MSRFSLWMPATLTPSLMDDVNRIHARFAKALKPKKTDQEHLALLERLLHEFSNDHPDDAAAVECAFYWLLSELVEYWQGRDGQHSVSYDVFKHRFPSYVAIVSAVLKEATTDMPRRIGRYEVLEELGTGSFGTVYLAFDANFRRNVAIKAFGASIDRDTVQREVQHQLELRHESIVPVYDIDYDREQGWHIAMAHIDGPTLADLIKTQSWPLQRIVEFMTQLCEAVAYAHKKEIIHRDLKPSNILVGSDGVPRITDFGLAVHRFNQPEHIGELAGTLAYMSPEQIRRAAVGHKSDVWSLGVIFFELLQGKRPFRERNSEELRNAILTKEPTYPVKTDSKAENIVWRACVQSLQKSQVKRLTCQELLDTLKGVRNSDSVTPRVTTEENIPVNQSPQMSLSIGRRTQRSFSNYLSKTLSKKEIVDLFVSHGFTPPSPCPRQRTDIVSCFYASASDPEGAARIKEVFTAILDRLREECDSPRPSIARGARAAFTTLINSIRDDGIDYKTDSDGSSVLTAD